MGERKSLSYTYFWVKEMTRIEQLKKNKRKIFGVSVMVLVLLGLFGILMYDNMLITEETFSIVADEIVEYHFDANMPEMIAFELVGDGQGIFYDFEPESPLGHAWHHGIIEEYRLVTLNTTETTYIQFTTFQGGKTVTFRLWRVYELFGWL